LKLDLHFWRHLAADFRIILFQVVSIITTTGFGTRDITSTFFGWMILLIFGGGITEFLSHHTEYQALSGMFSALGKVGPCFISIADMAKLHPVIKIVYIMGMLGGRLEILPVLLLFSRSKEINIKCEERA
jgi:Trk-type K+ transport system membrane component